MVGIKAGGLFPQVVLVKVKVKVRAASAFVLFLSPISISCLNSEDSSFLVNLFDTNNWDTNKIISINLVHIFFFS
ncbi:hypothetical protein L2E82_46412 [Cichorium intybus]|uniref:Uncharacterized protein n=1 Tax=Cichorium intybus TaxID=13427 RepID=A0ACB8YTU7_CICIN|nr:hypothetical protein L2E82_46412 [Cichorium intybus]